MALRKITPLLLSALLLVLVAVVLAEQPVEQPAQQPAQQTAQQSPTPPVEQETEQAVQQTAEHLADEPTNPAEGRKEQKTEYLRVTRDDSKVPATLETAIVRCTPIDPDKEGPTVDLVGAVHVADAGYYDELNRAFADYDVVLYELVAPEGAEVPHADDAGRSPLAMLQLGMTDLLDLEYQLGGIDYTAKNLVHADMSPEEFSKSMEDRGESFFALFLRMMGYSIARQQSADSPNEVELLMALFAKDRALALKRVLAGQFEDMEGSILAIDGPEGSTLIAERNKVAIEELGKQIAAGKQKIAIFYGAAHMSDFERRIRDKFKLAPVSTRWLVAWAMKSPEE